MEEGLKPSETEIRRYFEENKEHFGLKTLNEVRKNIERILRKQMHAAYMPKYVAELRRNAFIRKSPELLKSEEPSEAEINRFYLEHRAEYQEPEMLKIRQIKFRSRPEAEKARNLLWSGASFTTVAEQYSESLSVKGKTREPGRTEDATDDAYGLWTEKRPRYIRRGERSKVFDESVFSVRAGETSIIFEDNEAFYIVQVLEKHERRIKSLEEVIDSVRQSLAEKQEKKLLEDNANRTLFTVNNRSYSVEEFVKRYGSLSADSREDGKESTIERMIEYELLVDDARRKMFDLKNTESVQDITRSILQGSFYEKEIVGKIGIDDVTDAEAQGFYDRNKESFMRSPKATISYIRIPIADDQPRVLPPSEGEKKAAKRKADEARSMIIEGSEFDVVARKYSADDWSTRKHVMYEQKDMPFKAAAEMDTHPLHKVVFALEEGGISKPIKFRNSYYIFRLWEKSGKTYFAFNEVKKAIKEQLVIEKRNERMETLNKELTEKAELVLNKRALRKIARKQTEKKI
jgi:parvulin-like peptidyl-prolyl isomerase